MASCHQVAAVCLVQVMSDKQNRQMLTLIGGFALALLLLYYLFVK